jgi:hypothetical protein
MEKKHSTAKKAASLKVRTETLRRLDDSELLGVAGGMRIRIPVGFEPDTMPIYDDNNG